MTSACQVIDMNSVSKISSLIAAELEEDTRRDQRDAMRTYYFGDVTQGASTEKFWRELTSAIHDHDVTLQGLQRTRTIGE
jgi:hypothetical protein